MSDVFQQMNGYTNCGTSIPEIKDENINRHTTWPKDNNEKTIHLLHD